VRRWPLGVLPDRRGRAGRTAAGRPTFGRTVLLAGARTGAPTRLALHNVRGFSRRLTTVIVPLALALAVGTIQTSVNSALDQASEQQLRAAVTADLVSPPTAGTAAPSHRRHRGTAAPPAPRHRLS
jgi:hypothetical protein